MNEIRAREIKSTAVSHRQKQSQTDNGRIPILLGYGAFSTPAFNANARQHLHRKTHFREIFLNAKFGISLFLYG